MLLHLLVCELLELLVVSVPVEGHGTLPVSLELALVDGDGLLQNAVTVNLAVTGPCHPPHVILQHWSRVLCPAETRRDIQHPPDKLIDMN